MDKKQDSIGKYWDDEYRDERIKKELRKLKKIIRPLPKDRKLLCEPLIENIAFHVVQLEELRLLIMEDGYYDEYQNGENQRGLKKSVAADMHIQVGKNYLMFLGRLKELLPSSVAGGDELDEFNKRYQLS